MSNDELVKYLIERIDIIERKLDVLNGFRWKVIGIVIGISFAVTLLFQILFIGAR